MKNTVKARLFKIVGSVIVLGVLLGFWTAAAEKRAHYTPEYPMEDLEAYLRKKELSEEEYIHLFCQTGLGKAAIDELITRGDYERISKLQQDFFKEAKVCCEPNTIISREEIQVCSSEDLLVEIPVVENGDILITFNCHVLGWRVGHAGIVVDAENRQTLEARVLGSDSAVMSLEHWRKYPSFAVLRLRGATKEERQQIAEYAAAHLAGIPYRLMAGILTMPSQEEVAGTQCAHLVWYSYMHYGYNLDSNGGRVVTPQNLFDSPLLEVVQVYGMDIRKLKFSKES